MTKHLRLLERAGLVERERHGREVFIALKAEPLREAAGWLHEYEPFWNRHLDQFEQHFRDQNGGGEVVMDATIQKIELRFERLIPASPGEVYDAWPDVDVPGNPRHEADRLLWDPQLDGLFYWSMRGNAQYGRFTRTDRPAQLQHTWVSPHTLGQESLVTVTFEQKGDDTLMTLVHSELPDDEVARSSHEGGWNYFLGMFSGQFAAASRTAR